MPIIFYGDGKWASGVKGTKAVPQDMIDMFKRSGFPVMKIKEPAELGMSMKHHMIIA